MKTELLAADVEELIREAQGEARAAVKARLRAQFEEALLEAVDARLASRRDARLAPPPEAPPADALLGREGDARSGPATAAGVGLPAGSASADAPPAPPAEPVETGQGLWLYCITARAEAPDAEGVANNHRPRPITAAGLTALVSTVPLQDFGEQGLKRNLNDMPWLEAVARAHEGVLERTLENGPVVPMRLCTIYRSEEQVQALLAERREQFTDTLAALEGRGEWGVKVTADRDRVAKRLRERDQGRPAGVGGSYLGRKQHELRLRDEVDAVLDAAVQESHARLEEWAVASQLLPPQRAELSGHSGEMVLNGAYLVDDERLDGFRTVIEELGRQYGGDDNGLAFELTGPWPPYNFVGGDGL